MSKKSKNSSEKSENYMQQGYNSVQTGTTPPADLTEQQKREWDAGVVDAARQLID
ncbi:hypothetical protein [Nostoc sp. C052]|uniref:hypothetical protein n=1 Tax=Nostoc sp. C052 TaxID=2576902 RepID=UPI0015C2C38E|nr:hypothetical protein [Nostoc sp. C052]